MSQTVREYATGAARSALADKLQYEGFLNPLVLKRFAEYMRKHQIMENGERRTSWNWQKNIPLSDLLDSKIRHDMDVWLHLEGYAEECADDIEESLCAVLFNTAGILKQALEARGRGLEALRRIRNRSESNPKEET